MQNKVIFQDGMDVDPADFNNLQVYVQGSFDSLIADTVSAGQKYAELKVTKTSTTAVTIGVGRLYVNGISYRFDNALVQNFQTQLPIAGNRIMTIVAIGITQDTNVVPREFLINEATNQSQPKAVATETSRICQITVAAGTESPSPTAPLISTGYTPIADVLLTPTGVATITMRTEYAVGNLDDHDGRLEDLEDFEAQIGPKVTTLGSDLAALAIQLQNSASNNLLGQLLIRVASLESKTGIPTGSVSSHADYYLDASKTDLANPLSNCKINEGIRFPDANRNTSVLGVLNPLDPTMKLNNGLLFPAYSSKLWMTTGTPSDQVRISSYSYQTNQLVQKQMSRQVTQYGAAYDVCTNSAFWLSGTYDPIAGIFTRNGETFKASLDLNGLPYVYSADGFLHVPVRIQQYWTDTVTETYWDNVTVGHNVNGAFIAETFLQGQDIWLESVGLFFTKLADTGDATIAICEVSSANGLPDLTSVISYTNLPRASMKIAPSETKIPITPCFLTAGKRYAVCVISAADHWLATVPGEQFTSGTFFYVLDGAYAQGDGTKDLQLNLYRAVPNQTRTSINLNPLNLDGGILGIKINADTVIPSQCSLTYEIQVNGTWYALSDVDSYTLGQGGAVLPLLPFRVTMVGSADMMPCVTLPNSQVDLSRPGTSLTSITKPVQLPATSSQVRVIHRYENWNPTYHTAGVKLLTGGSVASGSTSYTTVVSPTSFTDVTGVATIGGAYCERTYVFNLGAAVNSFSIRTDMTTTSNRVQFHVGFLKDYEL